MANSASARRLQKELAEVRAAVSPSVQIAEVDEANLLRWELMLKPEKEPYNKGAFRVVIEFPVEYPFKPPKVKFLTMIYHPNVDEQGNVCLALIQSENWKPATRTEQVMNALLQLIAEPEFDNPLRGALAEECQKDARKFAKTAEEFTKKHAEKR